MDTNQTAAHLTIWMKLKPERVQEPTALADAARAGFACTFELTVHQPQPVTVSLIEPQIAITLPGNPGAEFTAHG